LENDHYWNISMTGIDVLMTARCCRESGAAVVPLGEGLHGQGFIPTHGFYPIRLPCERQLFGSLCCLFVIMQPWDLKTNLQVPHATPYAGCYAVSP